MMVLLALSCLSSGCRRNTEPNNSSSAGGGNVCASEEREIEIADGVKMKFVWVAQGTFQMGSDNGEDREKTIHEVTLTKGYWIGKYEVTQTEWKKVMGNNPSHWKGAKRPVEWVSWNDCQDFIGKINERLENRGEELRVRLPTEAEWEFAARGGTKSKGFMYCGSDLADEVAWYGEDWEIGSPRKVGLKSGNELGIHDMSGNVCEWCADWFAERYSPEAVTDPSGPDSGDYRVLRGGGWSSSCWDCRPASRSVWCEDSQYDNIGFRLAAGQ